MSGIYIHIPFCKQACYYCDFHFSTSLKKKKELVKALARELQWRKDELKDQTVETIYFGGGTPSLLTSEELQFLMDTIDQNFEVSENPEITLEANPDDLVAKRIHPDRSVGSRSHQLKKIGINRLSIGIQSFFEDDLKNMNRAHDAKEAKQCLEEAIRHFDNITIDLIYGIPNMNLEKWNENLQIAFGYGINHISAYALTVEPKTALDSFIKKGNYPPIDEQLALNHFEHLMSETKKQGFVQYEISNFGKPNFFSRHNTSYWQGESYLGIGPSAHSFNRKERSWNVANNTKYIQSIQKGQLPSTSEILTVKDRYNEYIMTGLRTVWGVSLNQVESNFGLDYKMHLLKEAEVFLQKGLVVTSSDFDEHQNRIEKLTITEKGKFLADGIAAELFILN